MLKRVLMIMGLTAALSACSSSTDTTATDGVSGPQQPQADQPSQDSPVDAPAQNPQGEPEPAQPSEDSNPQEPVDQQGQSPGGNPANEPDDETDPPTTEDPATQDPDNLLIPDIAEGSDLDRLVRGLTRQVSVTLLSLNQKLNSGEVLTETEDACLGAFDPAVGEQLMAIDCESALSTGGSQLRIGQASFYGTDACNASISNGNTQDCYLQSASMNVPVLWSSPASGTPTPLYAGSTVSYAIDNTALRVESLDTALTGAFRCDVELDDTSQTSSPITGLNCSDAIRAAADRVDALIPED